MKKILCLLLLCQLCSCAQFNVNPHCAFEDVRTQVESSTGHLITWTDKEFCNVALCDWVDTKLQNVLTLQDVIDITLIKNNSLQATYENLGIAQSQIVQACLLKNPIFSLSLRYDELIKSPYIVEMGLVQNFLDILLKPLKKKLACTKLEMIKKEIAGQVLDVIAEATISFYSLQAAEHTLQFKKEVFDVADAALCAANRLFDAGNITELALSMEQIHYEQSKMDITTAEVEVFDARERLNISMGIWGKQISWVIQNELDEISDQHIELCHVENQAITNSFDLDREREKMRETAIRVGLDSFQLIFPEITVGLDSERESSGEWFLGPQMSLAIPIFDIGQARTAEGRAELSQKWKEYCALAVAIRSAARSAAFRYNSAFQQLTYSQEVLVPLAEKITKETQLQFNAMQLGVFDLLNEKKHEIEIKLKAIQYYKDYWITKAKLETIMNGRMLSTS